MHDAKRRFLRNAAKVFDILAALASFVMATWAISAATSLTLPEFLALRVRLDKCVLFAVILVVWHYIFAACGLYVSKRLSTRRSEAFEVVKATALASAFLYFVGVAGRLAMAKPSFLIVFWLCCTTLMVCGRIMAWAILGRIRMRGLNPRFVLILGTNSRALNYATRIVARPELGFRLVGFVDNNWAGLSSFEQTANVRCCDFAGLAEFLRRNVVDEVAIYLPMRSYYEHAANIVALCEQHGIMLRFDSQLFDLKFARSRPEDFDGDSQIMVTVESQDGFPMLMKRILDFTLSLLCLAVSAPLFLLISLAVLATSPGGVFFAQKRVGLNKRRFTMYKFRTMIPGAESLQETLLGQNEMSGPVFKITNDPRVTPVGRILRNTSLDELPQLWNVLKGDMSLVGPRPMSVRDYQLFSEDWQCRRFSVRPGMTCLWQVNGRNSIPFEQWMQLDMLYIDQWSLWLDLTILLRTIPAVLRGAGAASL
jgi:exopolysaccharide biosynthesis polyprenyl glycosylphosphotransferase